MVVTARDSPPLAEIFERCGMNEEIGYAEMLEIPVETVTMHRKEKRKHRDEGDLSERVVEQVNDRMEETDDPQYAESTPIAREEVPKGKIKNARRILIGEFVAVCALCAVIFFTNLFMPTSAINTFVRGLFAGNAVETDERTYADFKLSSVVRESADVELAVSDAGVLSFEGKCSVYAPCEGKLVSVNGDSETGYTLELKHSDSFSTVIAGVDAVYFAEGDTVMSNVPLAYTDGEGEVRVTFYDGENALTCYAVKENNKLAWS